MHTDQKAVIEQIDRVIDACNPTSPKGYSDLSDVAPAVLSEAANRLLAAIERLAPPNSRYAKSALVQLGRLEHQSGQTIQPLIGILKALKSDIQGGYLQSVQELIHADIFGDFLEMASHLLQQGYKDPAAVVIGSVLEEHIRKLALKAGIPDLQEDGKPKKADLLNAELVKESVYSKLDQKNVTAWLDLRNKAAHGHYAEYTKIQVDIMLQSVRDFFTRNVA
jgi:hypothetical protein